MPGDGGRREAPRISDRTVLADANAVLDSPPKEGVHFAITSPPFNLRLPYRGRSDDRTHDECLAWLAEVRRLLHQVLVPGGRFALNVASTSTKDFRLIQQEFSTDLLRRG